MTQDLADRARQEWLHFETHQAAEHRARVADYAERAREAAVARARQALGAEIVRQDVQVEMDPEPHYLSWAATFSLDGLRFLSERTSDGGGGHTWDRLYLLGPCRRCGSDVRQEIQNFRDLGRVLMDPAEHAPGRCPEERATVKQEEARTPPPTTTEDRLIEALRDYIGEIVGDAVAEAVQR